MIFLIKIYYISLHQKKKNYFDINIKIEKEQAKEIKIYENGKYEGIIIKGKREKTGTMEYNDGTKYEGEWNNDKKHGKCKEYKSISRVIRFWFD